MAYADMEVYIRADKRLKEFLKSERLHISEHLHRGKAAAQKLVELLRKDIRIDRHVVAETIGRRRSSKQEHLADVEVYIFFDVRDPSKKDIHTQNILDSILALLKPHKHSYWAVKGWNLSTVQVVDLKLDIMMDVCIAVNFGRGEAHYEQVYGRLHAAGTSTFYENYSLVEKRLEFMNSLDDFTKDVVTLARTWLENVVKAPSWRYRQIRIAELLAIKVAVTETDMMEEDRTMSAALERFFRELASLWPWQSGKLRVLLDNPGLPDQAMDKLKVWRRTNLPEHVVLDPVNPYINYLTSKLEEAKDMFPQYDFDSRWKEVRVGDKPAEYVVGMPCDDDDWVDQKEEVEEVGDVDVFCPDSEGYYFWEGGDEGSFEDGEFVSKVNFYE